MWLLTALAPHSKFSNAPGSLPPFCFFFTLFQPHQPWVVSQAHHLLLFILQGHSTCCSRPLKVLSLALPWLAPAYLLGVGVPVISSAATHLMHSICKPDATVITPCSSLHTLSCCWYLLIFHLSSSGFLLDSVNCTRTGITSVFLKSWL